MQGAHLKPYDAGEASPSRPARVRVAATEAAKKLGHSWRVGALRAIAGFGRHGKLHEERSLPSRSPATCRIEVSFALSVEEAEKAPRASGGREAEDVLCQVPSCRSEMGSSEDRAVTAAWALGVSIATGSPKLAGNVIANASSSRASICSAV